MPEQPQAATTPQGGNGQPAPTPSQPSSKNRSPDHPAFDLKTALDYAQKFYDVEALGYANRDVTIRHWDLSPKSSTGMRTLAGLLHYGLLEEDGTGTAKRFRLSKLGQNALLNPNGEERQKAIREAAMKPSIYRKVLEAWDGRLPSDAQMTFDLETTFGFNRNTIDGFIASLRATLEFAGLSGSAVHSPGTPPPPEEPGGDGAGQGTLFAPLPPTQARDTPSPPPVPPSPKEAPAMPVTHTQADVRPVDIVMQLDDDVFAVLRLPNRITPDQYEVLDDLLKANLKAVKRRADKSVPGASGDTASPQDKDGAPSEAPS